MINRKPIKAPLKKGRLLFIFVCLLLVYIGLETRLFFIMRLNSKFYKEQATKQWINTIPIEPKRGKILDRNGQVLAMSSDVYRIDADLSVLNDELSDKKEKKELKDGVNIISLDSLAQELTKTLNMSINDVLKILKSTDSKGKPLQFVSIKRKVEKNEADAVKALKLNGIMISQDIKRYYPDGSFLSQVIGHTNAAGDGITGIELSYNKELTGIKGVKIVERDMKKNELPYTEENYVEPVDGKDVVLTLDERIQELAESTALQALQVNKAKSVSITIMNPKNGEVLAMVNKPDYDPNAPEKGTASDKQMQDSWKNSALSNIFEPGSIFKVMTAAAALEYNKVKEGDTFKCDGSTKIAGTQLFCDEGKAHGIETFSDIIKNSCNIGFIQLAGKVGKNSLLEFAQKMGFGKSTGIDLPGESSGILRDIKNINDVEFATMSYGHGLAVTQIQYMAALNAVANGGTWIKPHVMKEIKYTSENGSITEKEFSDLGKKTVMNKENTDKLRTYLQRVVKEGTATATYMEGYHIAGKTGTAVKVNTLTGGYEPQKYVSSFACMVPAEDPVVTIVITIDEPDPKKYYAGETAVPAAKDLILGLSNYLPLTSK